MLSSRARHAQCELAVQQRHTLAGRTTLRLSAQITYKEQAGTSAVSTLPHAWQVNLTVKHREGSQVGPQHRWDAMHLVRIVQRGTCE